MDLFARHCCSVEKCIETRHQLFRRGGIQKLQCHQCLLQMGQHATDLNSVGLPVWCWQTRRFACILSDFKAAQSQSPLVGNHLQCSADIERAETWIARDTQRDVAAVNIFIAHAKTFRPKQKGNSLPAVPQRDRVTFHQLGKVLTWRPGGWAEIARRHGSCAQVRHSFKPLVQGFHNARLVQHVECTAGPLNGLFPAQHVGPPRSNEHQIIKTHGLHGAGRGAHIAGMAGVQKDESRMHRLARKIRPYCRRLHRQPNRPFITFTISMSLNLHPMVNVAVKAARTAGSIINRAALDIESVRVSQKKANDFVTEVDQAAEAAIIETLLTAYPGHGIWAEESGREHGAKDSEFVWIIDPLDGTTNFIHGLPVYCVSIALAVKGKVEQAVVYDPTRNDLFTATKGRGAFLNDRRLRVSKRTALKDSLISTGFPYRQGDDFDDYLTLMGDVMQRTAGLRRPGAAALDMAYVAAGFTDGFFEKGLQAWDVAAGSLLVTEAGGLVGNFTGEADFLDQQECLAGNPRVYAQMVSIVSKYSKFAGASEKAAVRQTTLTRTSRNQPVAPDGMEPAAL